MTMNNSGIRYSTEQFW